MAEKDTLYHELRDALAAGGCPLCRMGRRAARRYLAALLYESVNDVAQREALRQAHGFCRTHAWQFTRQRGAALSTSIIYQDVVRHLFRTLQAADPGSSRRGASSLLRRLEPARPCPACGTEEEEVQRMAATLLAHLDDLEMAGLYASAGGLCLPHLRVVLGRASAPAAERLRGWQLAIYERLVDQLGEFIRKNDHRFSGEPIGAEGDAWLRAVAAASGVDEANGE